MDEGPTIKSTCPFCASPLKRAKLTRTESHGEMGDFLVAECDLCKFRLIYRNHEWQTTHDHKKDYEGLPLPADFPERVKKLERFINDHEQQQR